jgi:hypothetical protein
MFLNILYYVSHQGFENFEIYFYMLLFIMHDSHSTAFLFHVFIQQFHF